MKLTVLGSGAYVSGCERAASGFALEIAGETIIVDLGFGCYKNLQRAVPRYSEISKMFFTHFEHCDHINDLSAFIFACKGFPGIGLPVAAELSIFAGRGFTEFIENLVATYPTLEELPFELNAVELDVNEKQQFQGFALETVPVKHTPSSLGLRFQVGKKVIAFTGDTAMDQSLIQLARDADLLVAECSYAEEEAPDHLNAAQVAEIASKASCGAVLLVHLMPAAEEANLQQLVSKKFKGKVLVAEDLLQVDF